MPMVFVPIRCLIPNRLRHLRRTQQWLSEKTGIPKQRISDYIHLRVIMSLATAVIIARALEMHIEDIYVWEWRGE